MKLWDLFRRKQVATLLHKKEGVKLGTGTIDGRKKRIDFGMDVEVVVFSRDGQTLASGSVYKTIMIWDVATGAELATLRGHTGEVHGLAFSPDGTILASASLDRTVKLWNVDRQTQHAHASKRS